MDISTISLADLFAKGVTTISFIIFLLFLLRLVWKRYTDKEDQHDKESLERENVASGIHLQFHDPSEPKVAQKLLRSQRRGAR